MVRRRLVGGLVVGVCAAFSAAALAATPSPAAFRKQANQVCTVWSRAAHAIGTPTSAAQAKVDAVKAIAYALSLAKDLRALHAPAGDTSALNLALNYLEQEVAPYRQAEADAASPQAFNADLRRAEAIDAKARAQFRKLGLLVCASWDI